MNQTVIETQGLAKAYKKNVALHPLNLSLVSNRIYGLIGRNGSGKSTLIKLLSGIEEPTLGKVKIADGNTLGHISSDDDYPNFLTLVALANLFASSKKHWDNARYLDVLSIFALETKATFGSLSTGQKSGVKLAVMLAQKPSVWLLDEATLGIDIIARGQSLTALLKYFIEDQPCVLVCTHDINEIERLADEVIVMEAGKIRWQGEKDNLSSAPQSLSESVYAILDNPIENKANKGVAL